MTYVGKRQHSARCSPDRACSGGQGGLGSWVQVGDGTAQTRL